MKHLNFYILAFLFVLFISCKDELTYKSVELTLQPNPAEGKDAFVEDYPLNDYRNLNMGDQEGLAAMAWTADGIPFVVRSYIGFNFDAVPATAVIDSARLALFAYGNIGFGMGHHSSEGTNECYIYRIIEDWEEDEITWNNQPGISESTKVLIERSSTAMQDYLDIDVTSLVKEIIQDRQNSFGFMFRLKYEDGYRRMFFSSSDVEDATKRPRLKIYYSVEE